MYDEETGFYYLQSRYYDPEVGRFISSDVLLSTGQGVLGHNAYAYCLNNPVNMSDSCGCMSELVIPNNMLAEAGGWSLSSLFGIIGVGTVACATVAVVSTATETAVSTTADKVTETVEKTKYCGPVRDQSVYVMRDKATNEVRYVGRTNNPMRRQLEHAKDPKKADLLPLEVKFSGLTKSEARAMEQLLISAYSLGNLYNARREIAVGNVAGYAGKIGNIVSMIVGTVEDDLLNLMGR